MSSKVKMRIYRLKITPGVGDKSTIRLPISTGMYLLGVNENDVQKGTPNYGAIHPSVGTIKLTPANFTGGMQTDVLRNPLSVYEETPSKDTSDPNAAGRLYVFIAGVKYYILRTQLSATFPGISPDVFEFYLNPQHVTPKYRQNLTELRTRGGWDVQHWGQALTELTVQGKSGGLNRDSSRPAGSNQFLKEGDDITTSSAWKKLDQLKTMYLEDHIQPFAGTTYKLGMNYYNTFYIGYFADFSGPEADAMSPLMMTFGFTFKIEQEVSSSMFGSMSTSGSETVQVAPTNNNVTGR